jgi:hypothetical protein
MELVLKPNQYSAVINILNNQSVPFANLDIYYSLYTALKSSVKIENSYKIELEEKDLEILISLVENGSVLIREIPFAIDLLKSLSFSTPEPEEQ